MKKNVLAVVISFVSITAFGQSLPAKMEGMYSGQSGGDKTYIELVKMERDKAVVKFFVASSFCNHGVVEGVAEKKDTGWVINAPGKYCADWAINLKPVEGKQRLEGTFQASSGNYGTVYYEW